MTDVRRPKLPAGITPSATVGPYFAYGLTPTGRYAWKDTGSSSMAAPGTAGTPIAVEGRVLDGDGAGVPDAMIEIWQADATGNYNTRADGAISTSGGRGAEGHNAHFLGWGRIETSKDGGFKLTTIKPGPVVGPVVGTQAPHLLVAVFARGMLRHLYTRIYFSDDGHLHATDPVLQAVPVDRRATLLALRNAATGVYQFDLRIQGGAETVFFDI